MINSRKRLGDKGGAFISDGSEIQLVPTTTEEYQEGVYPKMTGTFTNFPLSKRLYDQSGVKVPSIVLDHINTGVPPPPPGVGMFGLFWAKISTSRSRRHLRVSAAVSHFTRFTNASYWYCASSVVNWTP